MYTLDQIREMAEMGIVDWSAYEAAIDSANNLKQYRTNAVEAAIAQQESDEVMRSWMASQDAMFGSQTQQYAQQLEQATQQASIQGRQQAIGRMRQFFQR